MIELLVVMAIFGFVIVGASQMFVQVLRDYKQQSEITMSNIEGIVGLELMRRDVENAGYGLFWDWREGTAIAYNEVDPADTVAGPLSDVTGTTFNPPRALVIGDNTAWKGSDRLAVKAVNVTMSERTDKWTYFKSDNQPYLWNPPTENLLDTDLVVVISPEMVKDKLGSRDARILVPLTNGQFSATVANRSQFNARRQEFSFMFVVDPNVNNKPALKMPFNRADFYINSSPSLPANCAQGTGILYKAVVSQEGPGFNAPLPLLDCVADMQVAVVSDDNSDGTAETIHQGAAPDAMAAWDAKATRNIREVQIYILAQEGMRDSTYDHPRPIERVGAPPPPAALTVGRDFDFAANGIPDWRRYRWKLYTLVLKPMNLK